MDFPQLVNSQLVMAKDVKFLSDIPLYLVQIQYHFPMQSMVRELGLSIWTMYTAMGVRLSLLPAKMMALALLLANIVMMQESAVKVKFS